MKKPIHPNFWSLVSCFVAAVICSVVWGAKPSYAVDRSEISNKGNAYNVYKCIDQGYLNGQVTIDQWQKTGLEGLVKSGLYLDTVDVNKDYGLSGTTSTTTCYDIIKENYSGNIPSNTASESEIDSFLTSMGYAKKSDSNGGRCATFSFSNTKTGGKATSRMCVDGVNNNDGKIAAGSRLRASADDGSPIKFSTSGGNLWVDGLGYFQYDGEDFNTLVDKIQTAMNKKVAENKGELKKNWTLDGSPTYDAASSVFKTYTYTNSVDNANKALQAITGYEKLGDVRLTAEEQQAVLESYLVDYYGLIYYNGSKKEGCGLSADEEKSALSAGYEKVQYGSEICYVAKTKNTNLNVAGFGAAGFVDGTEMTYDEVLQKLGTTSLATGTNTGGNSSAIGDNALNNDNPNASGEDGDNPTENSTPVCYTAAQSIGWILCPVISGVGSAVKGIYDYVVAPFLQIDADLIQSGSDQSTYAVWSKIRSIANIIFAIAFIFVILAQITGIGLSNYNIKKMLPRLLVVVVLVNVSFLLCQLAVDISNIAGNGLEKLFTDLAHVAAGTEDESPFTLGGIVSTALTGLFAVGTGALLALNWDLWIIPFALALITGFIGIIFFFVILGVRQAAVIILIAVCPAAVACYALPNTKSIFDKWWKLFSSMIVVYPVCGALMGAGKFASALLVKAGGDADKGFLYQLIAMLISVVPFFMIPSIVRRSMEGIGNVGAKLTKAGRDFGKLSTRGMMHTELGKEAQRAVMHKGDEQRLARLTRSLKQGGEGKITDEAWNGLSGYERRRIANTVGRINALDSEDAKLLGRRAPQVIGTSGVLFNREVGRAERESMKNDIAGQDALYESGEVGSDGKTRGVVMTGTGENGVQERRINYNNTDDLKDEYVALLRKLDEDPSNYQNRVKLRTIQNRMVGLGGPGQEKLNEGLREYFGGRGVNQTTVAGDLAANKDGINDHRGLLEAMAHLNAEHAATIKAGDRGTLDIMNTALSSPDAFQNKFKFENDANGNVDYNKFMGTDTKQGEIGMAGFDAAGAGSYSGEALGKANDGALDRLLNMLRSGQIGSRDRRKLASEAMRAIDGPNSDKLNPTSREKLVQIASVGASLGAQARNSNNLSTTTEGSELIGDAGNKSLQSIVQYVQSTDLGSLQGQELTNAENELRGIAENSRRFLESGTRVVDAGNAESHQAILDAVRAKGIKDLNGDDFARVDPTHIKIRGATEAPKPMTVEPVPRGWTESGVWIGGGRSGAQATRQDEIAYDEWARHKIQVERHNRNLNRGAGGNPSNGSGGGSGSGSGSSGGGNP